MSRKNDYETQDLYGALSESISPGTATIIPFPVPSTTEASMPSRYISSTDLSTSRGYNRFRKKDTPESFLLEIDKISRKQLEDAFDKITDASDLTISASERSNCFDDWCKSLKILVRSEENFSRHHQRILGTLLSTINKRDIADFSDETLRTFRDITNTLRQPRLSKIESKRAINDILNTKIRISLPLGTQGIAEDYAENLLAMLNHLAEQSQ